MDQQIHEAIEACYAAFARRPPTSLEGCPCCTSKVELRGLLARPLRELAVPEVDRYAFSAMTTIGTIDDFRYFWPRVAELAVSGQMLTDIEVVFGKLAYGRWAEWPERERVAVSMLVDALSARFGQQRLEDADSWLCALGRFVEDLGPCLRSLLVPSDAARANLTAICEWNRESLTSGKLCNAFWGDAPANRAAVAAWLGSREVRDALDRAG